MFYLRFILSYMLITSFVLTHMFACNDLFSRFEQQTSILEKQAEATDQTTIRHGHDGPSQGLVSKHLENLKLCTENRLSELRDGMAGRTVIDCSVEIDSLTLATTCRTDRRRHDGPSQVAQILGRVGFLVKF